MYEVLFYKDGFFGFGEKGNFEYWSFAHFAPILVMLAAIVLIYIYRDRLRQWKHEETFRFIFAFVMLMVEMSYFWRLLYVGSSEPDKVIDLLDKLPLQVCEWTCIIASFMLMKKSKNLFQICFFVCLTFGLFPLLTPSVITTTGPAYYRYYQYWLEHILPIIAVFYMMFVHGARARLKGIILAVAFMSVLATLAIICNLNIEGANYLYLGAEGTSGGGGSPMDILPKVNSATGTMFLRLGIIIPLFVGLLFGLYYLSAFIEKKWTNRKSAKNHEQDSNIDTPTNQSEENEHYEEATSE